MKTLSIIVPDSYYNIFEKASREQNITKSEAFRNIYSLNEEGFSIDISAKEKPILLYMQSVAILIYAMCDYLDTQIEFYKDKNKEKYKLYLFLQKHSITHYQFFSSTALDFLTEAFETLSDDVLDKSAERMTDMSYLIEKGTNEDWNIISKLAKKYKQDYKYKKGK